MIYVDTSVVLAELLGEPRRALPEIWSGSVVASRLLEYEVWFRLHAYGFGEARGDDARHLLGRVALIELSPEVLTRALLPFPRAVRTLDALHLATAEYLLVHHGSIQLATLDERMREAATAMDIPLAR